MIGKQMPIVQTSLQDNPKQKIAINYLLYLISNSKKLEICMENSNSIKLLQDSIKWKGTNQIRQFKYIFLNQGKIFKSFQGQQQYQFQQFLCAKMFETGITQQIKKHSVYHCKECGLEYNSILCSDCFDFTKHQGHIWQKTDVEGGCCDCGDDSKWKAQGFCEKHKYSNQGIKKMSQFDEENVKKLTTIFQSFYLCHIYILCVFYQNFMEKKKNKQDHKILQIMLNMIDIYGGQLIKSLININKNRAAFNQITRNIFKNKIVVSQLFKFIPMENGKEKNKAKLKTAQIKLLLFSFFELKETSTRISELFILLCYKQKEFRKQITVQFIKRYNQYPQFIYSGYQQLAPQLLSNSQLTMTLINQSRMIPLQINFPVVEQIEENQIRIIVDKLELFYRDISYMINLKDQSAKSYWYLFTSYKNRCFFQNIAPHATIFMGNKQALKYINKHLYKIEHTCMKKILQIAKLMIDNKDFKEIIISKLFLIISCYVQKDENDLFFTYERIWIMFTFMSLTGINDTNISFSEISSDKVQSFISVLQNGIDIKKGKDDIIKKSFQTILKRLIRYWHRVCFIVRTGKDIQQKQMFYRYYLKDDHLLFNLDSLLFKLIIKIFAYYDEKQRLNSSKIKPQSQHEYSSSPSEFQKQNSIEVIIHNELQYIQTCINQRSSSEIQKLDSVTFLLNFINLLSQVIYSDIPELSLSTQFKKIHEQKTNEVPLTIYERRILQIYKNYYQLLTNNNITKRQFKQLIDYLFLQETKMFNKMCQQNKGDEMHLVLTNQIKKLINLKYYQSQKYKLRNTSVINMLVTVDRYQNHPYVQQKKNPPGYKLLKLNKIWQLLNDWLFRCYHDNITKPSKYSYHLLNQITEQYIKLMYLLRDLEIQKRIRTSYLDHRINRNQILDLLTNNNQKIIGYIVSDHFQQKMETPQPLIKRSKMQNAIQQDENFQNNSQDSYSIVSTPTQPKQSQMSMPEEQKMKKFQKTKTIDMKICNICRDDAQEYLKNSFVFYFVRWSNLQPVGLDKNQKVLIFTTCGHYFHQICLKKQEIFYPLQGKCPRCKSAYNYVMQATWDNGKIILPGYECALNNSSLMRSLQQLKRLKEIMKIEKQQFDIIKEIIKSIIANSLYALSLGNTQIKEEFLNTFQCLWERLKCLQEFQRLIPISFRDKPLRMQEQLPEQLIEIIFKKCSLYNITTYSYLFDSQTIEELRMYIKKKFAEGINRQYFKLIDLPKNLKQFQDKQNKWSCSICKKKGLTLYVCLIDRGQQIFKICQKCESDKGKKEMINYIKQEHLNECIFIRTDNGRIYYYALFSPAKNVTNVKIFSYQSIYVNTVDKVGQAYTLGQYYPKKQYFLDREELKKIQSEFFSLKKMSQI